MSIVGWVLVDSVYLLLVVIQVKKVNGPSLSTGPWMISVDAPSEPRVSVMRIILSWASWEKTSTLQKQSASVYFRPNAIFSNAYRSIEDTKTFCELEDIIYRWPSESPLFRLIERTNEELR